MKKILSAVIAAVLALSCVFTAFAATDDEASPDETVKVTKIELTKLPDKLTYTDDDVVVPDIDDFNIDFSDVTDDESAKEYLKNVIDYLKGFDFELNLDLTGAEVTATYSDATTKSVDIGDCTAVLADPFNYGDFYEQLYDIIYTYASSLDEEDLENMTDEEYDSLTDQFYTVISNFTMGFYKEYTVNVSYEGASATYTVNFVQSDTDYVYDDDNRFEVVSPNGGTEDLSSADTATKDTDASGTSDNGSVQTGTASTAAALALTLVLASGAMFVLTRKRLTKKA